MLGIVTCYYCIQFQGKRMVQTQENGEKSHFGPDLGLLGPNPGRPIFFIKLLVRHCFKLSPYAI